MYEFALNNTAKDYKSRGALLNNLTEAASYVNPTKSIEYGKQSLEYNKIINSAVECGKSLAAISIAYSKLSLFDEATKASDEALELFDQIGYKAGKIFALFSKLVCEIIKNDNNSDQCKNILQEMQNIYNEIEVYQYLIVYARLLCGLLTEDTNGIEWLDREKTFYSVKELIK